MATIAHLLDDARLGGVTGVIRQQRQALARWQHRALLLRTDRRLAPRIDADLIIVHFTVGWSKLPFLASLKLRNPGRKVILVEHSYTAGFERHCVPEPRRFRAMLRLAYRMVDHVVAVSHGQASWMREHRLVVPGKLAVITQARDLPGLFELPPPGPRRRRRGRECRPPARPAPAARRRRSRSAAGRRHAPPQRRGRRPPSATASGRHRPPRAKSTGL